jgi:hypothetical protein
MALKYKLTDAEHKALDTERMSYYKRGDDGWWTLDLESDEESDKAELVANRDEIRTLKAAKRHRDEVFGTSDPDEQRRRMAQAEQTLADGISPAQFEKITADAEAAFQAKCTEINERSAEVCAPIIAQLRQHRTESEIVSAMRRNGVRVDSMNLLKPHVMERVRTEGDDPSAFKITVTDENGNARVRPDGVAYSVDELLTEWRILDPFKKICFEPSPPSSNNGHGPAH